MLRRFIGDPEPGSIDGEAGDDGPVGCVDTEEFGGPERGLTEADGGRPLAD